MTRCLTIAVLLVGLLCALPVTSASADQSSTWSLLEVDASAYPIVTTRLGYPADLTLAQGEMPDFEVSENGIPLEILEAAEEKLSADREVVLLVDVSGSMRGGPIEDAKSAAASFVRRMTPDASVAIVAFSTDSMVISGFTRDQSVLLGGLDGLTAAGETALYDGLRAAVRLPSLPGEEGSNRVIVLLSDGEDTTSVTTLDTIIRDLGDASIPVLAVAIESPEFNKTAVELIANRSGGRTVPVDDTVQMVEYLEQIAQEITGGYSLTFRSKRPTSKDLEVDIVARANGGQVAAYTSIPNPMYVERITLGPGTVQFVPANPMWRVAAILLAFSSVGLITLGALLILQRPASRLDQVTFYDQVDWESSGEGGQDLAASVSARVVGFVDTIATRGGLKGAISVRLVRAGIRLRAEEFIALHTLIVLIVGFLTQLLSGSLVLSAAAVALASFGPIMYLDSAGNRRMRKIEEQLPDALNLLASGLRTGWGLQQAIDMAVTEGGPPIAEEFRRVQIEARLGIPVERALGHMADRLGSKVFEWAVTAISIQREVGGNLAEVLDSVARTVRERDAVKRQIDALTAEARLSALILTVLPFLLVGGLMILAPAYLSVAMGSPLGGVIAVIALVLVVVGIVWLRSLARLEY